VKLPGSSSAMNLKLALVIIGAAIAFGTLYYTQNLVNKLQHREREIVQLYAKSLEYVADPANINEDFTFIFLNVVQRIDFPIIITDSTDQIISTDIGVGYKNIEVDSTLKPQEIKSLLNEKLSLLRNQHHPIYVKSPNNKTLNKIFYGDSYIVNQLKYYPYL